MDKPRNRLIKDNRVAEYSSPNLPLAMRLVVFGNGISRWLRELKLNLSSCLRAQLNAFM
jgi:hypothetical protein